jgi:hypothetical protein
MADIRPIEPKNHKDHPLPKYETCPKHEFSMLLIAPKGSGKTNLICNLILNHYKGYFHQIWVCSPTAESDEKWDVVKKTKGILVENKELYRVAHGVPKRKGIPKVVHGPAREEPKSIKGVEKAKEDFDGKIPKEDFFERMEDVLPRVAEQKQIIERLKDRNVPHYKQVADRILVILDDQAGSFPAGCTTNPMSNFVIKHRHTSTSIILVTQAYKMIPKSIRTNCNCMILFRIPNLMELKMIYEENPEGLNEQEWMQKYEEATNENFSFMYINNKFPKNQTIFKNLDQPLFNKEC